MIALLDDRTKAAAWKARAADVAVADFTDVAALADMFLGLDWSSR